MFYKPIGFSQSKSMEDYYSYRLSPQLSPYIDCVWGEKYFDRPENSGRFHRIVPDNSVELVISAFPIERRVISKREGQQFTSHLAGLKTRPQEIKLHRSCLLSIRFRAHGLYHFTGIDAREFVDRNISPELVFGTDFKLLEEQLLEAAGMPERLRCIEKYFSRKLNRYSSLQDPLFEAFLQQLEAGKGMASIGELMHKFNVSIKTIERKCLQHLGITPKKYSRLVRLFHALRISDRAKGPKLTDIAYRNGYYDQMHFIKEVKYFTGMSPGSYFQEDRGIQEPIFR